MYTFLQEICNLIEICYPSKFPDIYLVLEILLQDISVIWVWFSTISILAYISTTERKLVQSWLEILAFVNGRKQLKRLKQMIKPKWNLLTTIGF